MFRMGGLIIRFTLNLKIWAPGRLGVVIKKVFSLYAKTNNVLEFTSSTPITIFHYADVLDFYELKYFLTIFYITPIKLFSRLLINIQVKVQFTLPVFKV